MFEGDIITSWRFTSKIDRLFDSNGNRLFDSVVHGRPKEDDSHRRHESHDASPSLMEGRALWALRCRQDRPSYHSPFPNVLRFQLVLHLAYVLLFYNDTIVCH
jgi:hypothetical protein